MKGTVTEAKLSKSGKSYIVQIGGQGYFAKLDSKLDQAVGKPIDFSVDPTNYQGKTINWVRDWDFEREQSVQVGSAIPAQTPASSVTKQQSNGDRWWLPFCSNQIAHLIQVGVVKDKATLNQWAKDLKDCVTALDTL